MGSGDGFVMGWWVFEIGGGGVKSIREVFV